MSHGGRNLDVVDVRGDGFRRRAALRRRRHRGDIWRSTWRVRRRPGVSCAIWRMFRDDVTIVAARRR